MPVWFALLLAVWLAFLVKPALAMPFACIAYLVLVGAIGWSALRDRREGWLAGLLLSFILGLLPVIVALSLRLYEALAL